MNWIFLGIELKKLYIIRTNMHKQDNSTAYKSHLFRLENIRTNRFTWYERTYNNLLEIQDITQLFFVMLVSEIYFFTVIKC